MEMTMTTYAIPTQLPLDIFRTYDIRGVVNETSVNENVAYAIGLAIGTEALRVSQHEVAVACDARLTGQSLKNALMTGITETGCNVIDIGVGPTPMVYFATNYLPTKTGVMVTASHNPWNHNGFKIVLNGKTLSEKGIQAIVARIQRREFLSGEGSIRQQNIIPDYINAICAQLTLKKPMKIVIDVRSSNCFANTMVVSPIIILIPQCRKI
jgi:phosphomannomutase/phosphoglucomutase